MANHCLTNKELVKNSVKAPTLVTVISLILCLLLGCHESPSKPNIVLIMADDMGFSDIGCYGGEIKTPNLDQLATNGLRFSQFYNAARCCPTRASLLTGLYPQQTGHGHMEWDAGVDAYRGDLNNKCVTIAEALKGGGYATYGTGKWHVTKQLGYWTPNNKHTSGNSRHNWPLQRGFDRWYGIITGAADYFNPNTLVNDNTPIKVEDENYYFTDAISTIAKQYIEEHTEKNPNQPFFLYIAYTAPHWPLHALPEDIARYKGKYDQGWNVLREQRYKRQLELGIINSKWELPEPEKEYNFGLRQEIKRPAWEEVQDKTWQTRRMEVYAAQIDRMDQGIGQIISALKKTDNFENTLILFLSDNGASHGKWPKVFEHGNKHMPEYTRDGRPVRMGDNPEVMPGPEDTYQSYGLWWASASDAPFRKYKGWVHEGGIATPLLAHWPSGINRPGEIENQMGHIIDIMPTCLEIANIQFPKEYKNNAIIPMEGMSILPAFDGKPINRGPIFWEHEGNGAMRDGKWKLVRTNVKTGDGPWELYDMERDRTETTNLAGKYPQRVKEMAEQWQVWADRIGVLPWEKLLKSLLSK